ncbi:hypothetical protein HUG10_21170 (plasmid) [Halorarum halophilum]|uniref:Uncharacterized protein n=1 Tax=Halorarum halophilum TaxID=2743090 RepID=A0A7D5KWA7_9EURY|nr:hypothetical protein [Halobaculum halophilum]QLG30100.1 hypothetical protein HUG10_21170 [Halobaculum halophilum]
MYDRDSPVEWTGEAHLVTVSCDAGCGKSLTVAEEAAVDGPVTCNDCERKEELY